MTAVVSGRRRLANLVARVALGVACLALVSATFPIAMAVENWRHEVSGQYETPPAQFSPAELARFRNAVATAGPRDPLVLAYHDVSPIPNGNPYVVTPRAFEGQMRMLAEAGYRTLGAAEFVRYLNGGDVPPQSVLITFDDGTHGLWTYADRILARYDFRAVAFLITDAVGTHRPYYLSWREIARMQASQRWDFGSHTSDLHYRVPIDASGRRGSALVNRRYLERAEKLEPLAHYKARVRADLEESIRDITSHGLPRPRLFVFPFSEYGDAAESKPTNQFMRREVRRLFEAALANQRPRPGAVSRRTAESGVIERGEVTADMTTTDLFELVQVMSTLPLTGHDPVTNVDRWLSFGGYPASVRTRGGAMAPKAGEDTFVSAAYAPQRTADWVDYRVRATVTNLDPREGRTVTGTVSARVDSANQIDVKVSSRTLEVTARRGHKTRTVTQKLPVRRSHTVSMRVDQERTVVIVDGAFRYRQRVEPGPASTGGIGVRAYRGPGAGFPAFARMWVMPGA